MWTMMELSTDNLDPALQAFSILPTHQGFSYLKRPRFSYLFFLLWEDCSPFAAFPPQHHLMMSFVSDFMPYPQEGLLWAFRVNHSCPPFIFCLNILYVYSACWRLTSLIVSWNLRIFPGILWYPVGSDHLCLLTILSPNSFIQLTFI